MAGRAGCTRVAAAVALVAALSSGCTPEGRSASRGPGGSSGLGGSGAPEASGGSGASGPGSLGTTVGALAAARQAVAAYDRAWDVADSTAGVDLRALTALRVTRTAPSTVESLRGDQLTVTSRVRLAGVDRSATTWTRRYRFELARFDARRPAAALTDRVGDRREPWELPGLQVSDAAGMRLGAAPAALATLRSRTAQAVGGATRVLASGWVPDRPAPVLVVLPRTAAEWTSLTGLPGAAAAAVTVGADDGGRAIGADRVILEPQRWARLSAAGQVSVLAHELAHVILRDTQRAVTGPAWAVEGFAQVVGYGAAGLRAREVAGESIDAMRGLAADGPPTGAQLESPSPTAAYLVAWSASRALVSQRGLPTLLALARGLIDVRTATGTAPAAFRRTVVRQVERDLAR